MSLEVPLAAQAHVLPGAVQRQNKTATPAPKALDSTVKTILEQCPEQSTHGGSPANTLLFALTWHPSAACCQPPMAEFGGAFGGTRASTYPLRGLSSLAPS